MSKPANLQSSIRKLSDAFQTPPSLVSRDRARLERGLASVVELERRGKAGSLRRAATVKLPESLLTPSFEELNIKDHTELAAALNA